MIGHGAERENPLGCSDIVLGVSIAASFLSCLIVLLDILRRMTSSLGISRSDLHSDILVSFGLRTRSESGTISLYPHAGQSDAHSTKRSFVKFVQSVDILSPWQFFPLIVSIRGVSRTSNSCTRSSRGAATGFSLD